MKPANLEYRPHIDGLRAVAVLAVLVFHAFPEVLPGGFVGVDIFFVISGFLISRILYADFGTAGSSGARVIANFYGRRVRRIFPALIVVLAACLLLGFHLLLPGELEKMSWQIVAGAGFCLNLILAGQTGYFNADATTNPLLHLWSLGVEEQFYLVWPLVIWGTLRCRIKLLPAVVFLAACSFCWSVQTPAGAAAAAFYLPQTRLWELAIGAIAAAVLSQLTGVHQNVESYLPGWIPATARRLRGITLADILSFSGLALIGAGILIIDSGMNLPNAWTLLPTTGAALVVCSDGSAWANRRILSHPLMVWIGLISYPLYLWHWPLLTFARLASDHPITRFGILAVLACSMVLAWLTYKLVETPVRRARRVAATAAALAGMMAVVASFGYYTRTAGGFPSRFPPLLNQIAAFRYDPAASVRQGTYFLQGDQDETNFKRDPNEINPAKPSLYLWGDSHAACLYPGLSHVFGQRYNIVQRTSARTPPFVPEAFNHGNARQINQYILDSIRETRPEFVLLAADWQGYHWPQIEATIDALKTAGIHHIVLVGPVPHWIGSLPQQLNNYARQHRNEPVPVRMQQGADPETGQIDRLMAALAGRLGVEYLSPCAILGNQDGFLVRTGDGADSLTTYDTSHLTVGASDYLVAHFPAF